MAPLLSLPAFDWKPILELRARFERRIDRDFSRPATDNRNDLFSRFRAGANFTVDKGRVKGQVVYQYAHNEDWSPDGNLALWRSDILLAYGQTKIGEGTLTAGRQRLKFGSERLLGALEWNNVSYAWDGARYAFGPYEVFAAKFGVSPLPNDELRLVGAAFTKGDHQTLAVYKHDEREDKIDEVTVSQLYRTSLGKIKLDAEVAGQIGHRDGMRKLAGAFDAIATAPVAPKLSFSLQGSVASGGGDDDTTNTFDQLYPAGHDRHGLIDMTAWKNVRDLGLWFCYTPDKLTSLKLQYHSLGLDSARDAWYASNGKANGRPGGKFVDPTGARGRDLGDEYDFDFARKLNLHQSLRAGIGLLQPGRFVRSFNGSATKDQVWGYVQWSYSF